MFLLLLFCTAFVANALACDPGTGIQMPSKPLRSCLEYKVLGFPTGSYEIQAAQVRFYYFPKNSFTPSPPLEQIRVIIDHTFNTFVSIAVLNVYCV